MQSNNQENCFEQVDKERLDRQGIKQKSFGQEDKERLEVQSNNQEMSSEQLQRAGHQSRDELRAGKQGALGRAGQSLGEERRKGGQGARGRARH